MKVLFVSNGNVSSGVSPIIKNQGESLRKQGVELEYFPIRGKGWYGYLNNVTPLRKRIRETHYDLVHGHYSLSCYIATLAGSAPLVVSLMGSDVYAGHLQNQLNRFLNQHKWSRCIVKSQEMYHRTHLKNCFILPNGVDTEVMRPLDKAWAQNQVGFDPKEHHVLFASSPGRWEKNYLLARHAVSLIRDIPVRLHVLEEVPMDRMPVYYAACDVLLLTSFYEGSPNVIKEAMACNTPIVTTDVGDVRWVLGTTKGCYIAKLDGQDVADKLMLAIEFARENVRTQGRKRILELGLESRAIAGKLIGLYEEILAT